MGYKWDYRIFIKEAKKTEKGVIRREKMKTYSALFLHYVFLFLGLSCSVKEY
jgi:hypothetical protein